jgi:hypothetical protein
MVPARILAAIVGLAGLATSVAAQAPDPPALAQRIDRRLEKVFQAAKVKPAPRADDAEFLRRVYLDITGRIPRPADVHAFLADKRPDRRSRVIDQLLAEPRYAVHFANVWRAELLPETTSDPGARVFQTGFEAWLRLRFRAGVGYDKMVRELLTIPLDLKEQNAEPVLRDPERPNPLAFLAVKEAKPENLAAAVTRSFLGIQLECAQCHNHPFASWKQEQFWGQTAFFAGLKRQGNSMFAPLSENPQVRQVALPNGSKTQQAVFLSGRRPEWQEKVSPRQVLADWITAPDNPYFARATVNRLWGHFFGFGLVDPIDDFRDDNPPADSVLLDELAQAFVAARFDLAYLIRAICQTQAYGRTSARTDPSQDGTRLPARMAVKSMTGEQFFDSLAQATGYREDQDKGAARRQFLSRFQLTGPRGEPETSVPQALTLLNGSFLSWACDPEKCLTLIAVTLTPGMSKAERIESLYLATLSRRPRAEELTRLEDFFRPAQDRSEREVLADIFWMLLNSAEFRLNH